MAVYKYSIDTTNGYKFYTDSSDSRNDKVKSLISVDDKSLVVYSSSIGSDLADIKFYYMSDLHLDHKIMKRLGSEASDADIDDFIRNLNISIGPDRSEQYFHFNLFAGDTSFEPNVAAFFYDGINGMSGNPWGTFAVLGNHELWAKRPGESVREFADRMDKLWPIQLLQNDVVFINWDNKGYWREKWSLLEPKKHSYDEIMGLSDSEVRKLCERSVAIIVGGMGFSGYDPVWNASSGMYNGTVTPEEDLRETVIFESLYDRMAKIAGDMSVIVLTHTPKHCWSRKPYVKGWTYVNGHTHHNSCTDVDGARIYSDNQIGYHRDLNLIKFKSFAYECSHDIFEHFSDGIHRISHQEFVDFHHSKAINCSITREGTIYMLKNRGYYMFIFRNKEGKLLQMKSGKLSKLNNKNIDYYLQMMPKYVECVRRFLKPYSEYQQGIARVVKGFTGDGRIHGCIVDIDYYNHLYVNPFDGTVTPYFAEDKVSKWVYPSVRALLKDKAPYKLSKLDDMYPEQPDEDTSESDPQDNVRALFKPSDDDAPGSEITYVADQEIYGASLLIYEFQRTEFNHIIRVWDEDLIASTSLPASNSLAKLSPLSITCAHDMSAIGPLVEYLAEISIRYLDANIRPLRRIDFFSDIGSKRNVENSSDTILYVMDRCFGFYNLFIDMSVAKGMIKDLKSRGPTYLPIEGGPDQCSKESMEDALIDPSYESAIDSLFHYHTKVFHLLLLYHISNRNPEDFLRLYTAVCTGIVHERTVLKEILETDGVRELLVSRMSAHIGQIRSSIDENYRKRLEQIQGFDWGFYENLTYKNTVSRLTDVLEWTSDPDNREDIVQKIIRSFLTLFLPSYKDLYSKAILDDMPFLLNCVRQDF